jgi:hypothetical protein
MENINIIKIYNIINNDNLEENLKLKYNYIINLCISNFENKLLFEKENISININEKQFQEMIVQLKK